MPEKLKADLQMGWMTNKLRNRENCCSEAGPGRQMQSSEINISSESLIRAVSRLSRALPDCTAALYPALASRSRAQVSHCRLVWSNRQQAHTAGRGVGGQQLQPGRPAELLS